MLLRSSFSSFPQYFQNVSNLGVRLHIHSVKGGCSINCFPESANLICRSTDISNCFIESLGVRDNESRLNIYIYIYIYIYIRAMYFNVNPFESGQVLCILMLNPFESGQVLCILILNPPF